MLILHYPVFDANPYQSLLFAGTTEAGVSCGAVRGGLGNLVRQLLRAPPGTVLHIHWVHSLVKGRSSLVTGMRLMALMAILGVWRIRGGSIVWTVHNLENHKKSQQRIDWVTSIAMAAIAQRVLVHGESAKDIVAKRAFVNLEKLSVVPHGNYQGVFTALPRSAVLGKVKFLFFGLIRDYKNVPLLIRDFRGLPGHHQLRVAGKSKDAQLQKQIEELAHGDGRISLRFEFVSDEELQHLFAWSDVVVLPYRDVLTSGSLLAALTAGRPVVAPRIGLIPEYVGEKAGFLYDPMDPDGLRNALHAAATCQTLEDMSANARARAAEFDWAEIGKQMVGIYRAL